VQEGERTLPARTVGDLLNETFMVYGRHFWSFIVLAAVVQAPTNLLVALAWGQGWPALAAAGLLSFLGSMFVYSAVISAVGQQYIVGRIALARCYARVWWRVVSLTALSILFGLAIVLGVAMSFLVIPAVVIVIYMVYWSLSAQAIVVEGYRTIGALRRSFELARGNWWRVLGISLVFGLVAIGLAILLTVPFALAVGMVAPEDPTTLSTALGIVANVLVAVAVPPVVFIAETLLYYDLRVRKENYNLAILSQEMGMAAI
jgi:hypothetical protein